MKLQRFLVLLLTAFFYGTVAWADGKTETAETTETTETTEEQTGVFPQKITGEEIGKKWKLTPAYSLMKDTFQYKDHAPWSKENWTFLHTNPGVKRYKILDDITFVGVPIFAAGWIAKSEKHAFRQQQRHSLVTKFKTDIDDYMQYFSPALILGLKIGGLEGRSDWGRLLATGVMSYFFMDWSVTAIKYTSKEMRPNGTSANSWPSGHTATSFAGATMLHKEYGLTRSPWFSVGGYGVATATGVLRVLNNAHWVSDVICGAGLGIMTTELAYAASDIIFGGKGLLRNNLANDKNIIDHPSFFSISMGMGWGSRNMDFDMGKFGFDDEDGDNKFNLKFGTSTAVGVEGAYFFNKYVGVGGRLRINASPIKGWDSYAKAGAGRAFISGITSFKDDEDLRKLLDPVGRPGDPEYMPGLIERDAQGNYNYQFGIESDHLTEFSYDVGAYFNIPVSSRFAVGSKVLVGRSIMQELNLTANVKGGIINYSLDDNAHITKVDHLGTYDTTWDCFTMGGNNTFKVGTGISLTYAYKSNYAWKLFLDYDFSRKTYTMTYNPAGFLLEGLVPLKEVGFVLKDFEESQSIKKSHNTFILGGSFTINF